MQLKSGVVCRNMLAGHDVGLVYMLIEMHTIKVLSCKDLQFELSSVTMVLSPDCATARRPSGSGNTKKTGSRHRVPLVTCGNMYGLTSYKFNR